MNPKITIETIAGKKVTVIRRPFDAEWVREQLDSGRFIHAESLSGGQHSIVYYDAAMKSFNSKAFHAIARAWKNTIVILDALPLHPKPEHAPLLYRYMAEGIVPVMETSGGIYHIIGMENDWFHTKSHRIGGGAASVAHATHNGERVEIAITITDEAHNG